MIERTILTNLIKNEKYTRRVIPYILPSYFHNQSERIVFLVIVEFIQKYNRIPDLAAVKIDFLNRNDLSEHVVTEFKDIYDEMGGAASDELWITDQTEKFCQNKAIENGLYKSMEILQNKDSKYDRGAIPKILSDALGVSFDNHIGHDFLENWSERYEFYHTTDIRVPFDLEILNKITKGGIKRKTLNVLMGGIGFGKTLVQCHMAAANLIMGKSVLYITLEMAEEEIATRIDANLLNITINELVSLPKNLYQKKIEEIRKKTPGKLIIKEYPTASAGADNFRFCLQELKLKKQFVPDIIYIDYLNICKSSRMKGNARADLYSYVKSVAEELRGLAVEHGMPIMTATQLNRTGFTDSDPGMEHSSESFGLPATADLMLAIITNEDLESLNQISVKQIKNRYNDPNYFRRFHLGCDRNKMRLYDIEDHAQLSKTQNDLKHDDHHSKNKFEGFH